MAGIKEELTKLISKCLRYFRINRNFICTLLVFVLCTQDSNPGGNFYPNFTAVSKGELSGDVLSLCWIKPFIRRRTSRTKS